MISVHPVETKQKRFVSRNKSIQIVLWCFIFVIYVYINTD